MLRLGVLAAVAAVAAGEAVTLTADNFEEIVFKSGKNAIVKFYAPWCGHCKAMAPAWSDLGTEYAGSNVIIGDVDATIHSELGSKYGVSGYPTLKYFTQETGTEPQDYNGGRSLDDLDTFVKDKLLVKCSVETTEGCTDKEKEYINRMKTKDYEEVDKQHHRLSTQNPAHLKAQLRGWRAQRLHILTELKESMKKK
eukprot:gene12048-18611_t